MCSSDLYFPTEDENNQAIVMQDVLRSVRGYATRVANMVDIRKFYKEHPDPHVAVADSSLADPEAARGEEGEAGADKRSPKDGGASPKTAPRISPLALPRRRSLRLPPAKAAQNTALIC